MWKRNIKITCNGSIKRPKDSRFFEIPIAIPTYVQSSLVLLPPVGPSFGAVKLLLGFTLTSSKSMPKV
jgi:hypothetical protein